VRVLGVVGVIVVKPVGVVDELILGPHHLEANQNMVGTRAHHLLRRIVILRGVVMV
jgi:hypothetical protein